MMLVDTHCHIQSAGQTLGERTTKELWAKALDLSPDIIIREAAKADVRQMICVGCDLEDSQLAVDFVQNRDECHASIGIHPHEAQLYVGPESSKKEALEAFAALAVRPKVIAVGETGLDYFYAHSPKEAQIEILKFQIELALAHDLPMIFHVREAFDDFWPVFDQYKGIRGVLHSFTDTVQNLEKAVERGLFIGVNGIATFAKEDEKTVMYRTIPQRSLLLETDAPFLTPIPFRGTINEPKHIRVVAEFLAKLRGEDLEQLAGVTTSNAKTLFNV
jgi:TatD DNase family protein